MIISSMGLLFVSFKEQCAGAANVSLRQCVCVFADRCVHNLLFVFAVFVFALLCNFKIHFSHAFRCYCHSRPYAMCYVQATRPLLFAFVLILFWVYLCVFSALILEVCDRAKALPSRTYS